MRSYKALTSAFALALALLLIVATDQLLASSRAAGLCDAFEPGLDGTAVNSLLADLPGTPGLVKVRGDPQRLLRPPPAASGRQEFMQIAVVFKGWFFASRQCVVSVKAGRVENSHVGQSDAYVMLNPVQTVRSR